MSLHALNLGFLVCYRERVAHMTWTARFLGGTTQAMNTLQPCEVHGLGAH